MKAKVKKFNIWTLEDLFWRGKSDSLILLKRGPWKTLGRKSFCKFIFYDKLSQKSYKHNMLKGSLYCESGEGELVWGPNEIECEELFL